MVNYRSRASRRWPDAEWIAGDGPFAVLAHCDVLTVTLHWTRPGADEAVGFIDRYGCGHACCAMHEVTTLDAETDACPEGDTSIFEARR